jgi:hypothetical protein
MITQNTYHIIQPKVLARSVLISIFFLFHFSAYSTVFQSTQDGAWTDLTTWQNNNIPTYSDSIIISHNITFNEDIEFLPGGYLMIDSTGSLCGKFDIIFVCGNSFYNYGVIKTKSLYLTDSWSYGKIITMEGLTITRCFESSYVTNIFPGAQFECDGCSTPFTRIIITDATNQNDNGKILIQVYDIMNENLYYTFSLDGVNYQTDNMFYDLPVGQYKLYIKDQEGCIFIKDFEIESREGYEVDVFPNPFVDDLKLKLFNFIINNVQLVDATGRVIYAVEIYGDNIFNLHIPYGLSKGIYFLNISNDYNPVSFKLIKE